MGKDKYIFNDEQIEHIKNNWGKESAYSMKKRFGCSWREVVKKAEELGFDPPKSRDVTRWTKEQDDYVRANAKEKTAEEIGNFLGRTENAIRNRGKKIGVRFMNEWTKEDEQILKEMWGYSPIETIAKKLDRSVNAITVRATKLHLGPPAENNCLYLKVSEIAKYMNVPEDRIRITWRKNGLKFHKIKISKKKSIYGIKVDELLAFLEKHQDYFDARYLEEGLIFSPEPEWLKNKRKRDFEKPPKEYRKWTDNEIKIAIKMLIAGKNYEEIGEKIYRSSIAVSLKLHALNYSYLLPQYWKTSDIKKLRENFENGFEKDYASLANELGRSENSIIYKCHELGYTKRRSLQLKNTEENS